MVQNGLSVTAKERNNLNAPSHERSLKFPGNRSTKQDLDPQVRHLLSPLKRSATHQEGLLPRGFNPVLYFHQTQTFRDVKNRSYPALPMRNTNPHTNPLTARSIPDPSSDPKMPWEQRKALHTLKSLIHRKGLSRKEVLQYAPF